MQDRLGDLLEDMELTDLVAGLGPQLLDHLGVKRRSVRSNAAAQVAFVELPLELSQESEDIVLSGIVLQDAKSQAAVVAALSTTLRMQKGPS